MFHSNQQEAQGATGCGKDKQHYERNSTMPIVIEVAPTKKEKAKARTERRAKSKGKKGKKYGS